MRKLLSSVAMAVAVLAMTATDGLAQYYKDKTITIIVGTRAGGTVDTFARTFSDIWSKHIPGNPTIVVKNLTGAGTMRAQNFVYEEAKPDGLTIYWGPWDPVSQVMGNPNQHVKYDEVAFLGGTGEVRVSYSRTDILPGGGKITKPTDIMKVDKSFKIGGSSATEIPTLMNLLSLDVLGIPYTYVGGYKGGSDVRAAQLRNEVHGYQTSMSTYRRTAKDEVAKGDWMGLYYLVPVDDDGSYQNSKYINDVPSFPDLYKELHGKMPSGPKWEAFNWLVGLFGDMTFMAYAPPGTPEEAVDALRAGYAAGVEDPAFVKPAMEKYGIPYTFVGVQRGKKVLATVKNLDPAVLKAITDTIESGK